MSTGVIRITAALFALALLLGVAGLYSQPAQAVNRVTISSTWASVPAARGADVDIMTTRPAVDLDGFHADGTALLADADDNQLMDSGGNDVTRDHDGDEETAEVPVILGAATDLDTGVTTLTLSDVPDDTQATGIADTESTDAFRTPLTTGDRDGYWLEVLTGSGAGKAGLIVDHVMVPAVPGRAAIPDTDVNDGVDDAVAAVPSVPAYGIVTFDTADGLSLDVSDLVDADVDVVFRVVEQNPSRTVELQVSDDDVDLTIPVVGIGDQSPYFTITVDSDALDSPLARPYRWVAVEAPAKTAIPDATTAEIEGAPEYQVFKFDLVSRSTARVRTVAGSGIGEQRSEPDQYWAGRTITYGEGVNAETVLITRYTDAAGFTLFPTPGISTSGDYTINIEEIPAFEDQEVTFRYGLSRRTVTTDKIGPIISSVSPAKAAVVQEGEIIFQADVIDVSSGYSDDRGDMEDTPKQLGLSGDVRQGIPQSGWIALEINGSVVTGDDPGMSWTEISDGWRMSYENDLGVPDATRYIKWRIIARDQAGAQTIQDHTSSTNRLTVDGKDPEITDRNSNRSPSVKNLISRTGDNWRASEEEDKRWRRGGSGPHTAPSRTKSESRKGILVVFEEAGGLDVSTVDASDFSVDGQTPRSVTVVDISEDSKSSPDSKKRKAQEVFLVMGSNLPSDGKNSDGAKLEVSLTGTVRDIAGNAASSGSAKLADGIPPAITVVIDDADRFDQESVTVTVTVDETLDGAPNLRVRRSESGALRKNRVLGKTEVLEEDEDSRVVGSGDSAKTVVGDYLDIDSDNAGDPSNVSRLVKVLEMDSTGARAYEMEIDITNGGTVPLMGQASLIVIVVNATDVASNEEETGDDDDWTEARAYTFELDPELNNGMAPGVTVAGNKVFDGKMLGDKGQVTGDDAEIEAVDPLLITIDFSRECDTGLIDDEDGCRDGGEAKEYSGDTHKTVTLSDLGVAVALADGTTARPDPTISTSDNIVYTLSISNPPVGDYTVSFKAEDDAGNVSLTSGAAIAETIESDFVVKAAVPTELRLQPGWNLISLPFQPSNPGINSILPSDHPASLVMSYDNASGLWVVSRRDADSGMFTGDVRQLVATTAYFVFTDSLDPIKLIRPGLATAAAAPAIPSAIAVKAGWNLVPVLTYQSPLPGDPPGSGAVSADDYLGALRNSQGDSAWLRALLWDTTSQTWISVAPNETVTRRVGDTNPCTGEDLSPSNVANGNEPCQAEQENNYKELGGDKVFNDDDTVVMEQHLPLGAGLWVWSTIDSVIFPTS